LEDTIVQITAGDCHSAALTSEGRVYIWGSFRENEGKIGLTPDGEDQPYPIPLAHHLKVSKIASGILDFGFWLLIHCSTSVMELFFIS
jgi:regulator of chromosome condensation